MTCVIEVLTKTDWASILGEVSRLKLKVQLKNKKQKTEFQKRRILNFEIDINFKITRVSSLKMLQLEYVLLKQSHIQTWLFTSSDTKEEINSLTMTLTRWNLSNLRTKATIQRNITWKCSNSRKFWPFRAGNGVRWRENCGRQQSN